MVIIILDYPLSIDLYFFGMDITMPFLFVIFFIIIETELVFHFLIMYDKRK